MKESRMKRWIAVAVISLAAAASFAAMTNSVNVGVTVGAGSGSYLTVLPSAVNFGTVNASPTIRRFKSNIVTCGFYAPNAPWSIAVTTTNVNDLVGLVARVGASYTAMPMKFWQANFGGVNPDPNVQTNWTGAAPCFKWIFDDGTLPAMTLGSSASQDTSPIPFAFAVDAEGAYRTNYASTVTFELRIE
jgi:hypothetical protein